MNPSQIFDQLRSLDPKNPGAWPRWVHFAAAILAAIVIIGAGAKAMIEPEYDELNQQKQKEQDLRTEFESKQQRVAALDAYKAQLEQMQHSFGDMLKQLPTKSEVANLLNDISQMRIAANLDQDLFQPQSEITREFYAELPNTIVVTGAYHDMGSFVSGVAALPRIVTIDEVTIAPTGPLSKETLHMQAVAKTYRYLDEGTNAPAPKPAGAAK